MYDSWEPSTKRKREDEERPQRVTQKQLEEVRKSITKKGPQPKPNMEPEPFVPYYRKHQGRYEEASPDRPQYYKFVKPHKLTDLATDREVFKSWKDQLEERKELDRKYLGGKTGVGGDLKLVGTMNEVQAGRFKKSEREKNKTEIDAGLNLEDHGFELDIDSHNYMLNGTRVPHKFSHWIEEPGTAKTSRDLRLLKKIERARQKAAEKQKVRSLSRAQRSNLELEKKHIVTRRMLRVSNMLLEEVHNSIALLPNFLSTQALTKNHKLSRGQAIAESMLITSGAITFTKVDVSRDLLHAKVFWEAEEQHVALAERELARATPAIRYLITQAVHMKYSPEITFVRETATQEQREISEVLKNVDFALRSYDSAADSPYLPSETPIGDSSKTIDVSIAEPSTGDSILLPFQEKLIRSRWTAKAGSKPEYETWQPPKL